MSIGITDLSPHEYRRQDNMGIPVKMKRTLVLHTSEGDIEDKRQYQWNKGRFSRQWREACCERYQWNRWYREDSFSHHTKPGDEYSVIMCDDRSLSIRYNNRTADNVFTGLEDKPYWVIFWLKAITKIQSVNSGMAIRSSSDNIIKLSIAAI